MSQEAPSLAVMLIEVSPATTYRTTYPFGSSRFWGDLKGEVRLKSLLNRLCRTPLGGKVCLKGWLRIRRSQVRVLPSAPHRYPRLVAGATLHFLWWLTSNFRRSSESVEALSSTRWSARSLFSYMHMSSA